MAKMGVALLVVFAGLSAYGQVRIKAVSGADKVKCITAARQVLGPDGEIALCGQLIPGDGTLDAVGFLRATQFKSPPRWVFNIAVRRIVILRKTAQGWETALDADIKQITNPVGFISPDAYIPPEPYGPADCSPVAYTADWSEALDWDDALPRGRVGPGILLSTLTGDGKIERTGFTIHWNPSVGRFQTYRGNYTIQGKDVHGEGFVQEESQLPHMFTAPACHCETRDCNPAPYVSR